MTLQRRRSDLPRDFALLYGALLILALGVAFYGFVCWMLT